MSNEHITTISEFELNLICDFFSTTHRQGPGSPKVTRRALDFIENLTPKSRIADIGCGTGGQTMTLAQHVPGNITGYDLFPKFIDRFNADAAALGLQDRVQGVVGSMDDLPLQNEELDLIWSEGAIYNIGFERGLCEWRRFLKPGGYIAVSDCSWLTAERPDKIDAYWNAHYAEIDTIPNCIAKLQNVGYIPVASFILPDKCWIEHYFAPLIRAQELFLEKYAGNKTAEEFVELQRYDAQMYQRYKAFYGYVFYIGKKI